MNLIVKIIDSIDSLLHDGLGNAITSTTRGSKQALSVEVVDGSGNQVTVFGADPVGLKDADNLRIDPATEDTLQALLYKLNNLKYDTGSNLQTRVVSSTTDPVYASVETVTSITNQGNFTTVDMGRFQILNYWWGQYSAYRT